MKKHSSQKNRIETDTLGEIAVPADRYWGAQTQRSLIHFDIALAHFRWGNAVIRAMAIVKKAAAESNMALGLLPEQIAQPIITAANEVINGDLYEHFPLGVFQTGSGTHTNMNLNEVIANRANELLGYPLGVKTPVHPNDHVNLGQSSNDVFPTAMHIAVITKLEKKLLPSLRQLKQHLAKKEEDYKAVNKVGRTHLQDAAPLTLGQEISAWVAQLDFAFIAISQQKTHAYPLAIGGTAVGTGLNTHPQFAEMVVDAIKKETAIPFENAKNKFFALSCHDPLVDISAGLRNLAMALLKIANDIRWLASGPRCGIGELLLPQNEPGSSIMPGKVNPTQCEALSMVCTQVFGNDATVAFANSQGNFQLNAYKPIIVHNLLESIELLAEAMTAFDRYCVQGILPNMTRITDNVDKNLMLVTALNTYIGYDQSAKIAKLAYEKNTSLKSAAIKLGLATAEQFDQWIDLNKMTSITANPQK
jgi:fumarate hydratase, class II